MGRRFLSGLLHSLVKAILPSGCTRGPGKTTKKDGPDLSFESAPPWLRTVKEDGPSALFSRPGTAVCPLPRRERAFSFVEIRLLPSSSTPMSSSPSHPDPSERDSSNQEPTSVSSGQIIGSLLLSVLVLGIIGYFTFDPATFRETLRHARPLLLLAAAAMALSRIGFGGGRLSHVSQGRLDLASGTRGQLAWYFFANVTPTVVGGGPVATFYVARDADLPVGESAALMLFCMLLNQLWFVAAIPVLIGASFTVDLLPEAAGMWGVGSLFLCFGILFLWGGAFAYFTLLRPRSLVELADWWLQWPVLRRFRARGMREMRSYFRSAKRLGTQSLSFYGWGFLLTALIWLSRYAIVFFIVRSMHAADPVLLFLRSAATMLVGLIMPTPGGSGGLEGLYALFIGPLMPETLMAPTLLVWRLLDFYVFIALGAYLFLHQIQTSRPA